MPEQTRSRNQVLLDEPFLTLEHLPARKMVRLTWKGHARGDQYRKGLSLALEVLRKNDVRYWLADLRGMTAIMRDDERWANEVWFPQLFATGLRRMAIIESNDYFNQTSVERSFTAVNGKLTFEVAWFRSPEKASAWLERDQAKSA
ncbi:MAG: hypothetical protein K8H89_07150 [Flavobacteriales bacterium]|jgi:hypothetical protein|nr:hypothetical protein [Flavobacteriales bacterium]MCB0757720.1 hypothetical protein [Flavobacteriales bacterium]